MNINTFKHHNFNKSIGGTRIDLCVGDDEGESVSQPSVNHSSVLTANEYSDYTENITIRAFIMWRMVIQSLCFITRLMPSSGLYLI